GFSPRDESNTCSSALSFTASYCSRALASAGVVPDDCAAAAAAITSRKHEASSAGTLFLLISMLLSLRTSPLPVPRVGGSGGVAALGGGPVGLAVTPDERTRHQGRGQDGDDHDR